VEYEDPGQNNNESWSAAMAAIPFEMTFFNGPGHHALYSFALDFTSDKFQSLSDFKRTIITNFVIPWTTQMGKFNWHEQMNRDALEFVIPGSTFP
jgi:hypothetical protein